MRILNFKFILLSLIAGACSSDVTTLNLQSVVFDTSIHCADCVNTMFDNLPKVAGVVDLNIELDKKAVTIVFDPAEISVEKLAEKINELGYSAYVKELSEYDNKIKR